MDVSKVLEDSHKGVTGRYTGISRVLQGCQKSLTRMLQECYMGVTIVLHGF